MAEHVALEKELGNSDRQLVPHDMRDQIVNFVRRWSEKTEIGTGRFIAWLDVTTSKFYDWRERCTGSCKKKILDRDGWRC